MYSPYQQHKKKFGIPDKDTPSQEMVTSSLPDKPDVQKQTKRDVLNQIIENIDNANQLIKEIIPHLDSACGKYVQILNELIDKKKRRQQTQGQPFPSQGRQKRKSVDKSKNSKKMYSKIASECHPDKTDDKEKHKLFMEAKDAMDAGDDMKVFNIYKQFSDELEMEDCFNIDREILTKTIELSKIRGSNSYKLSIMWVRGGQSKAKKIYLQSVMHQIQELEMEEFDL